MRITETQRAIAHNHARHQLRCLEGCPAATAHDLGRGREMYNRTHSAGETEAVQAAVDQLDLLLDQVYAGNPPTNAVETPTGPGGLPGAPNCPGSDHESCPGQ